MRRVLNDRLTVNRWGGLFAPLVKEHNKTARILNHVRLHGAGRVTVDESGIDIYVDPYDGDIVPRLFELYDTGSDTLKVRGNGGNQKVYGIGGKWYAVAAGAGGKTLDQEITISDNTYILIKVLFESSGITVQLDLDTTSSDIPNGTQSTDEDISYTPLHFIAWDSTNSVIDYENSLQLWPAPRIPRMG